MLTELFYLPYTITRRSANLYWDLLEALLAERDHTVILDRIEPDPAKGWLICLRCADRATIDLIRIVAERKCRPDYPLSLV